MSTSVVFQWCDGGILRQIQLEKASLAYRSIMAIIATVQPQEPNASGNCQTSEVVANGPKQLAPTPGEDPRSAAVAPLGRSPGLGPEEPLTKKQRRKGVEEHGGHPLAAIRAASEGVSSDNVTNENVAPMAVNCVTNNELNAAQAGTLPDHALPNGTQLHPTPTSTMHDKRSAAAACRTTSPARGPNTKRSTSRARSPATNTGSITTAQAGTPPGQVLPNGSAVLDLTPTFIIQENRSAAAAPRETSLARGPNVKRSTSRARSPAISTGSPATAQPMPAMPNGSEQLNLVPTTSITHENRSAAAVPRGTSSARGPKVSIAFAETSQPTAQPTPAMPNVYALLGLSPTSITQENHSAAAARRGTSLAQGNVRRSKSSARSPAINTVNIASAETSQVTAPPTPAMPNVSALLTSQENRSAAAPRRAASPARGPNIKKAKSPARSPATTTGNITTAQAMAQPQTFPNVSTQLVLTPTSITQENRSAAAPRATSPARGPHIKRSMSAARSPSTTTVSINTAQAMAQPQAFPNGSTQLVLTPTSIAQENRSAAAAPRGRSPARGPNIKRPKSPSRSAKARNGNHVHRVQCDECAARGFDDPIAGVRFKCAVCDHFDLCSKCERRGLHDHHVMLRFGRVADKILNWTSDARELHENLVKLQEQIYPPAQNDGGDRLVEVRRDANAVHGVTCKECGEQVVGVRYKCGVCPNHDICSQCEANGVHDKHITFRFSGVVSEVTSWKQMERRFGVKLVDELKSLQHKVAGTTATKPANKDTGETSNGSMTNTEKPPSETTQEPPMTLADALKEVESAARAMRMRELSEIAANLDLIKSGEGIAEALEQLDSASMAGGRVSYLGAWNTVSAVRNHPQHGAAARRLLAKWAAMTDEEARRERIRNSLRVACARAPESSEAPQCSGSSMTEANAAPPPDDGAVPPLANGAVENRPPATPNGVPHGGTQRVVPGGAAPRKTVNVLEEPLPKKMKRNGVGAHGGSLPAKGAAQSIRNGNDTNGNVAPTVKNVVVKNEPPPTPNGVPYDGTQQVGPGGAALHHTSCAPAIDVKATESTLLSLASYVAHTRGDREVMADEDASVTDGTVKSGAHLDPNNLPVEAVEALAAAIAAMADELPMPSTVKMEPHPTPANTSNVYDRLVCDSGM